ncbi:MAG: UbiA family prenyltransferase [Lysobacterales bacterium]
MQERDIPLCVDLDGTLIRTDLLIESTFALLRHNPLYLFRLPLWLLRGRAHLKREIARRVRIDVAALPYDPRVLEWLRGEAGARPHVLCTASDLGFAEAVAAHVGGFGLVLGSDGVRNLGGRAKCAALCERYGERGFDYAGNAAADLHVWRAARRAIVVNARPAVLRRARAGAEIERVFARGPQSHAWIAALRPHQWLKNALVFVPLLAAHQIFVPAAAARSAVACIAFCLCASGAYLLNDLLDLDADRRHPRKRLRPFAAGALPPGSGLLAALALTIAAFAVAAALSREFVGVLLIYGVTTLAYSLLLKRVAMLDVVTLAALYTVRIIGGAVAIPVEASFWLLAFSMFLFLSLAMVKRYTEIQRVGASNGVSVAGRGYGIEDIPLIQSLGTSSGYLSVLVFAFYIDSTASGALYRHHELLWLLTPVLLYWISRVWLLARRGEMHDDPVVFALTDRVSLGVLAVFALVIALAI